MKNVLLFLVASCFFSCQNDAAEKGGPPVKDTNLLTKEAANPYTPVDLSPMDMAYFPADFPVQKMNGQAGNLPVARVIYSRPHRQGRKIFGNLIKWGEPWRLGANEATEIQLFQTVTIQNKKVEKGQYVLYAIPYEDHWTIVFNSDLYTWGLKFNLAKDVMKFDIPSANKDQVVEFFSMVFEKTNTGADLIMAWENKEARLPIQL